VQQGIGTGKTAAENQNALSETRHLKPKTPHTRQSFIPAPPFPASTPRTRCSCIAVSASCKLSKI
jgi:hypothetical protein